MENVENSFQRPRTGPTADRVNSSLKRLSRTLGPEHFKIHVFLGSPRGTEGALAVAQNPSELQNVANSPSGSGDQR